jgi:hypothetical protein
MQESARAKPPQCNAWAKALVWLYTKLHTAIGISESSSSFYFQLHLLLGAAFFFLWAGVSSSEMASLAALALVVGFLAQPGGFLELVTALGGILIHRWYVVLVDDMYEMA